MSPCVAYCAQKAADNEALAACSADGQIKKLFQVLAEFWFGAAYRYQWIEDLEVEARFRLDYFAPLLPVMIEHANASCSDSITVPAVGA